VVKPGRRKRRKRRDSRWKAVVGAWLLASILRVLGRTLRLRVEDPHGQILVQGPVLWAFWHNRIAIMPIVYRRYARHRSGVVLTSASGDGEFLARAMGHFGLGSVRGSSSRRGAEALRELIKVVRGGSDVIITPDGPRGPRYHLHAGLMQLSALSGVAIVPIAIEYRSYRELRSWDAFRIPLPFSRVVVRLGEPVQVPRGMEEGELVELRDRVVMGLQGEESGVIGGSV